MDSIVSWCREGGSNPHDRKGRRILSPLRLPVPPSRLAILSCGDIELRWGESRSLEADPKSAGGSSRVGLAFWRKLSIAQVLCSLKPEERVQVGQ